MNMKAGKPVYFVGKEQAKEWVFPLADVFAVKAVVIWVVLVSIALVARETERD